MQKRSDRRRVLRISRKAYDIMGAAMLVSLALICFGIVHSFPERGTGDGIIQPIFGLMSGICALSAVEIALDGPTIRWLINRRSR